MGVVTGMHSFRAQRVARPHRVMPGQDVAGLPGGSLAAAGFGVVPRRTPRRRSGRALAVAHTDHPFACGMDGRLRTGAGGHMRTWH